MTEQKAIETLHREECSCVIANGEEVIICRQRGVLDLLELLESKADVLRGAFVADKVIGKGAAALMVLGMVKRVYADVISIPALELLRSGNIQVKYATLANNIINRVGTDICPVEILTAECTNAEECLPIIKSFVQTMKKSNRIR